MRASDSRQSTPVDSSSNYESSSGWEDSKRNETSGADADTESEPCAKISKKPKKKTGTNSSSMENTTTADESSAEASTSQAESSRDANTTTEDESTKAPSSRHSSIVNDDWTISEDCLLRGMKEAGDVTWVDIAAALRKPKKQVQNRWKVIKDEQPRNPGAETTEAETTQVETTEPETTEPETDVAGLEGTPVPDHIDDRVSTAQEGSDENEDHTPEQTSAEDTDDTSSKKKKQKKSNKGKQAAKNTTSQNNKKKKTEAVGNKWHKGTRNTKIAAENKKAKSHAAKAIQKQESDSGDEASSETSSSASPAAASDKSSSALTDFGYGDEEHRRQMRYLQDHVYEAMYPPEIHPQPDAHLSKRDCRLLSLIDSKQKRSKWLEMQANFFNVTGRMVPLDVIRDKCESAEEAERPKTRQPIEGKQESIEKWVDEVGQEDLDSE
ncbi:hypothetical protein B0T10DRAFT_282801 [Thelonectria olida]|uniref:Myb-like domain-containing protein n=1 Tax=Thelonectria olida TaxID=1576542 RepID=A0A9P8W7Y4_9HYPO|nr:hypothetical protein B0T10DRAFT_282801 [Thelonectria olida]